MKPNSLIFLEKLKRQKNYTYKESKYPPVYLSADLKCKIDTVHAYYTYINQSSEPRKKKPKPYQTKKPHKFSKINFSFRSLSVKTLEKSSRDTSTHNSFRKIPRTFDTPIKSVRKRFENDEIPASLSKMIRVSSAFLKRSNIVKAYIPN